MELLFITLGQHWKHLIARPSHIGLEGQNNVFVHAVCVIYPDHTPPSKAVKLYNIKRKAKNSFVR